MANTSNVDQMVQEILADMSLKEKAAIANVDKDKVPYLQYAFDTCIRSQLGKDDEMSKDVMHRIWEVLQESKCPFNRIFTSVARHGIYSF